MKFLALQKTVLRTNACICFCYASSTLTKSMHNSAYCLIACVSHYLFSKNKQHCTIWLVLCQILSNKSWVPWSCLIFDIKYVKSLLLYFFIFARSGMTKTEVQNVVCRIRDYSKCSTNVYRIYPNKSVYQKKMSIIKIEMKQTTNRQEENKSQSFTCRDPSC